jgi:Holliday junction resolvase
MPEVLEKVVDRSKNRTNKARGSAFERKVAEKLTADGYLVIRAAGSHGAADLVAVKTGQVLFVQVKLGGAGACSPAEWNEFFRLAVSVGALPILAYRPGRQGVAYWLVTGPKDRVMRKPPAVAWTPDELAVVAA